MRKEIILLTALATAVMCGTPATARAQDAFPTFVIHAGGLIESLGSNIQIDLNTQLGQRGTDISFENDLGFSKTAQTFFIDATWRGEGKSRLHFNYNGVSRDVANARPGRAITFRDKTFDVNSQVDAFFDTRYFSADYGLAFYRKPNAEFGISLGLTAMKFHTGIGLSGTVNGTSVSRNLTEDEEFTAPVPLAGIFFLARPHPRVTVNGTWRFIAGGIGDISGSVVETNVGVDYKLKGPLGVGASYYFNRASVTGKGSPFGGEVTYRFNGPQVYGVIAFK